jgi:plasmid stability protein
VIASKKQVSVYLSVEVHVAIKIRAAQQGKRMSDVVEEILRMGLKLPKEEK